MLRSSRVLRDISWRKIGNFRIEWKWNLKNRPELLKRVFREKISLQIVFLNMFEKKPKSFEKWVEKIFRKRFVQHAFVLHLTDWGSDTGSEIAQQFHEQGPRRWHALFPEAWYLCGQGTGPDWRRRLSTRLHTLLQHDQSHDLGHAAEGRAGNAGLWLCLCAKTALGGVYGLSFRGKSQAEVLLGTQGNPSSRLECRSCTNGSTNCHSIDWFIDFVIDCVIDRLIDWTWLSLFGWLIDWLTTFSVV